MIKYILYRNHIFYHFEETLKQTIRLFRRL